MDIDRIRGVIAQMKLSEKLALVGGGTDVPPIERLKVPGFSMPEDVMPYSASEPSTLALGCSFSYGLCAAISKSRALDAARAKKAFAGTVSCGLILDPMRPDACDFFSEDPVVTSELLKCYASAGVIGYVFTDALGQGRFQNRTIDKRALYELYLYPLRNAGKYAAALQLDGGYLNGKNVCTSRTYGDIYQSFIPSDAMIMTQYCVGGGVAGIAGNGAYQLGATGADKKAISRAIVNGELFENKLNRCLERTVLTAVKTHEFYKKPFDRSVTEVNAVYDTSVLLKNDGLLPTNKSDVTVFGDAKKFDDAAAFSMMPIADAPKRFGALNLIFVTDYEKGGIDPYISEIICKVGEQAKTVVALCGACATPVAFADSVNALLFCPYCPTVYSVRQMMSAVSPRGHLPFTWCESEADYPRNNKKFKERGDFRYESMYNGYMLFNNFTSRVMYPFGHGLDYTKYEISKFSLSCDKLTVKADFVIKNAGDFAGTALCQLYICFCGDGVYGLSKRLGAFKRVPLEKTENANVSMEIDLSSLAVYDEVNNAMSAVGGRYIVELGLSSKDIRAGGEIKVPAGSRVNAGLPKNLLPSYYNTPNVIMPFEPTAPEIERLLKVPFIKKADEHPDLDPPEPSKIKHVIKKAEKSASPRLIPVIKYKAETTPINK